MKDKLRDMDIPMVMEYDLDRETLTPIREYVSHIPGKDYGADPIGDGAFKMIPSGDIVDFDERNRRLS